MRLKLIVYFLQCNTIIQDKTNHDIWQCNVDMKLDLLGKNYMDLVVCKLSLRNTQMITLSFFLDTSLMFSSVTISLTI